MIRRRARLFGSRHAVATGHHLASSAAVETLARGGSLIDAMICASALLTVALPHATSLGGCGMMLMYDATSNQLQALNGSGTAPAAARPAAFSQGTIDATGPRSWLVPGLVALWANAHARFGRLPWSALFAPAIVAAEGGIGFSSEIARNLPLAQRGVRGQPGFAQAFQIGGCDRTAGELFRQTALATTLRLIADDGEGAFYKGAIARDLAEFSRSHGGLLSREDLAGYQAQWVTPVRQRIGDNEFAVMPPNSVGVLMLAQLTSLATMRYASRNEMLCAQIAIARDVLTQLRDRVADPEADWPMDVRSSRIPSSISFNEPGDTAGIALTDVDGNALVMLQSVFQPFGSGCVDPATGILMNNRLHEFSMNPAEHNLLVPGKRPVHTLNPYMVLRDGRPEWCAVSPGGVSQTTTGVQFIQNVLAGDMTLPDAIDAPRWSISRDGAIMCEPHFPGEAVNRLRALGLQVITDSLHPFYFGSIKAVRCQPHGVLEAAADLRREAVAMAT